MKIFPIAANIQINYAFYATYDLHNTATTLQEVPIVEMSVYIAMMCEVADVNKIASRVLRCIPRCPFATQHGTR